MKSAAGKALKDVREDDAAGVNQFLKSKNKFFEFNVFNNSKLINSKLKYIEFNLNIAETTSRELCVHQSHVKNSGN